LLPPSVPAVSTTPRRLLVLVFPASSRARTRMIGVLRVPLVRDEWKMNQVGPRDRSWALEIIVLVGV
jgi:hypothetical protein